MFPADSFFITPFVLCNTKVFIAKLPLKQALTLPATMNIIEYKSAEFEGCINIFLSNLDKFFDASELKQYKEFLRTEALNGSYFTVNDKHQIVGAGGFCYYSDAYWLDWGMIHRSKHGQGVGSKLLEFRINKIFQLTSQPKIKLCTSQYTVEFYKKFGFSVVNFVENGYGINLHRYELEQTS